MQGGALNLAHIPLVPPFPWFVWSRPSTGEEGTTLSFSSSNCYSNLKIVQNLRKKFVQSRPSTLPQVKKAPQGSFSLLSLLKLEIICTKGLFGESHPSTGEGSAALSFSFFLFFKLALLLKATNCVVGIICTKSLFGESRPLTLPLNQQAQAF